MAAVALVLQAQPMCGCGFASGVPMRYLPPSRLLEAPPSGRGSGAGQAQRSGGVCSHLRWASPRLHWCHSALTQSPATACSVHGAWSGTPSLCAQPARPPGWPLQGTLCGDLFCPVGSEHTSPIQGFKSVFKFLFLRSPEALSPAKEQVISCPSLLPLCGSPSDPGPLWGLEGQAGPGMLGLCVQTSSFRVAP